jgi:hypothetical protein
VVSNVNPWRLALRIMTSPTELGKDDVIYMPGGKRNPNVPSPGNGPKKPATPDVPARKPTPPAGPVAPAATTPAARPAKPPATDPRPLSIKDLLPEGRTNGLGLRGLPDRAPVPDAGRLGEVPAARARFPADPARPGVGVELKSGVEAPVRLSAEVPVSRTGLELRGTSAFDLGVSDGQLNLDWRAGGEIRVPLK